MPDWTSKAVALIRSTLVQVHDHVEQIRNNALFPPSHIANQVCPVNTTTEIYDFTASVLNVSWIQASFNNAGAGIQTAILYFNIDGGGSEQIFDLLIPANGHVDIFMPFTASLEFTVAGNIECNTDTNVSGDVTVWGKVY